MSEDSAATVTAQQAAERHDRVWAEMTDDERDEADAHAREGGCRYCNDQVVDLTCQTCHEQTITSQGVVVHVWSGGPICFEKATGYVWRTDTHYYLASPPGQPIHRKRLSSC